jgi:tetratricopeptide (TPR) repeat protein
VLYHLEEWDASIVQFNRSIAVHESRSIRPYSDSYNGLGFVYLKQGELDKAIANFEKAKDIEPNYIDRNNNDDPYFGLAEAWQKNGQPAKADEMRTLRECLESGLRYELCRLK